MAGGEIHSAWRAMSNYMDGIETANAVQGHGDLPRGRRGTIEYDGLDSGAQVVKNRRQIADRRNRRTAFRTRAPRLPRASRSL